MRPRRSSVLLWCVAAAALILTTSLIGAAMVLGRPRASQVSRLADVVPGPDQGIGLPPSGAPVAPSFQAGATAVVRESRRMLSPAQDRALKQALTGVLDGSGFSPAEAALVGDCLALVPPPANMLPWGDDSAVWDKYEKATSTAVRGLSLPIYPGLRIAVPAVPGWATWGGSIAIGYTGDPMRTVVDYYCGIFDGAWYETVLRMDGGAEAVQFVGLRAGYIATVTVAHYPGDRFPTALRLAQCAIPGTVPGRGAQGAGGDSD